MSNFSNSSEHSHLGMCIMCMPPLGGGGGRGCVCVGGVVREGGRGGEETREAG
jgi:hypothetical protein